MNIGLIYPTGKFRETLFILILVSLRFLQDIAEGGIEWALEKTVNITEEFTPPYFDQELQGLADASGLEFKMLQQIHMLGELTKVLNRNLRAKLKI